MKKRYHNVALLGLAMAAGCAVGGIEERTTFKYPPLGSGPVFIEGVVLDRGNEAKAVSSAIVAAVQALKFTVRKPPIALDDLPQRTLWVTDTIDLSPQFVARYGAKHPPPLPPGAIYGLTFTGMYRVANGEIRFSIEPELLERGQMSPFKRYTGPYVRRFFVDTLKAVIDSALVRDSEKRQRGA